MNIEFTSQNRKLQRHLRELSEKYAPPAQAQALNSTAGYIKREAVKIASSATGVQASLLRKRIAVPKKAKARDLKAVVFGGLWVVPVAKISPKPRKLKGGGVKYKVMPGQAINPKAFIAKTTNGTERVFARKGPGRLPIESISADIAPHVTRAIVGFSGGAEALKYYQKILFSQMDRKVRGGLIRLGFSVS